MTDPTQDIMSALYTVLNGNLSYNSVDYPVYTVPPKSGFNYVLIEDIAIQDDSTKDYYDFNILVTFEVVTSDAHDAGSFVAANNISTDLTTLLVGQAFSIDNHTVEVEPFVDVIQPQLEMVDTALIVKKYIRLRFWIKQ
jgi:hypothetical protein